VYAALLLAGCSSSSPLIPSIFLINMWYHKTAPEFDPAQVDPGATRAIGNIVGDAALEARVGWVLGGLSRSLQRRLIFGVRYFGICINPDAGSWLCSANASSLAAQVTVDQDPLNLIWVAQTFRESIVFPYLL